MNDKIEQFAKGVFEEAQTELILSDPELILQIEEGRTISGSFYISNDRDVLMQGILYSDCPYLTLTRRESTGNELSADYEFSAAELMAGETVNTCIHVITSCGETKIPVSVTVDIPAITYEGGSVKDLTGFATLAKESPKEALKIFKSEDFSRVLLYRDVEKQTLYDALIGGSAPIHAMEEFLVASRKKNRIIISIDRNNLNFDNVEKTITDKIIISKNTWGSVEISIRSDSEFIKPAHKRLWTDNFLEDSIPLLFTIEPDNMLQGENSGRIYIETTHQVLEVSITCTVAKKSAGRQILSGQYYIKVMREFINLRNQLITPVEFRNRIDVLTTEYRGSCEEYSDLAEAYAAIITSAGDMKDYVRSIRLRQEPGYATDMKTVMDYSMYLYVLAMYHSVVGDRVETLRLVRIMSDMYENEFNHWFIFYLLLITEPEFKNSHNAFSKIRDYIAEGCTSPLIYSAFCEMLRDDSSHIHEWNDSMISPLVWGAERGLLNLETAQGYAYHVSRLRGFNPLIYRSMKKLFDTFGTDDILQQICRMLINAGKTDAEALFWYEKGVEKQLRITQLYEYYLKSLPGDDDRIIPHTVLMYFALDNRLSDREKSKLFASVIKGKKTDSAAYKAYTVMMSNYARNQLIEGNIDADLAVIYEDCIKLDSVDETTAHALPQIMFRQEIICTNPCMEAVCVVHRELEKEVIVPFVNGRAYADIYSSDAFIFMIDKKGNRYYYTEDYTMRKLLHLDAYAEKCFEVSSDDDGLLAYMYIKCTKDFRTGDDVIAIRRLAHKRLKLRRFYSRNNLSALIYHYYEHVDGERLDEMLELLNLEECDRKNRNKWIELYIVRGMHMKALKAVNRYGYADIDSAKLGKMCEDLIPYVEDMPKEGDDTLRDTLTMTACEVFKRGGYSRQILEYLADTYKGESRIMPDIWKAASGIGLGTVNFEERILERFLLTEDMIITGLPIFESYLAEGTSDTIKKAYISYVMYLYITKEDVSDIHIDQPLWDYVRDKMMDEYNNTCLLARLKDYSLKDNLDESEKLFCEISLTRLYKSGIIMTFYRNFEKKLKAYIGTSDREILQCVARPGIPMKIRCVMTDGSASIIKAQEVLYGIYVKDVIVFSGERITYEFFEEKGGKKIVYATGNVEYNTGESGDNLGRLGMINDMLDTYSKNDQEALYAKMKDYIVLDETSKDLFTIL